MNIICDRRTICLTLKVTLSTTGISDLNLRTTQKEELHSEQAQLWINEIERYVHLDSIQTILDIGTGAGF